MIVFDCSCKWRWIIGKKRVYGPIYPIDLPGQTGYSRGRMMTREQFNNLNSDCAFRYNVARALTPVKVGKPS